MLQIGKVTITEAEWKECLEFASTSMDCPAEISKVIFAINVANGGENEDAYNKRRRPEREREYAEEIKRCQERWKRYETENN